MNAVAQEKGIQLSCVPEIVGVRNSLTAYKWEINKGNGWEQRESAEPSYFWQFDRSTDGYPEAADFASWRVRCYVISIYGKNSEYTPEQNINTDQYGTWKLLPPKVTVSVSNRAINLKMEQPQRSDNRPVYGTLTHRIEVKNPKIDTDFFKPAESLDPYASELNYKEGTGYVTAVISYTQIMPLEGQNDDPPGPTYTLYQFRITAANEATTSEPTIQNGVAKPTSVYDMVKGWYINEQGEKVKVPGALGAENIYTESLAAISANMGDITAGSISSVPEAGETKPNVLLDLDNEEFRIGNTPSLEDSGSEDAEYIHYTKGQGLVMKIKNFVVTALASIISGIFRVKAKGTADSGSFFVVNPESTADTVTGTPAKTVKINGNQISPLNFGKRFFSIPDMAGARRYTLIADITYWWDADPSTTGLVKTGFTGTITAGRPNSNAAVVYKSDVSAIVAYKRNVSIKNTLNLKYLTSLYTIDGTEEQCKPCVVSYQNKKYLALLSVSSNVDVEMSGVMYNLLPKFTTVRETDVTVLAEGTSSVYTDALVAKRNGIFGDAKIYGENGDLTITTSSPLGNTIIGGTATLGQRASNNIVIGQESSVITSGSGNIELGGSVFYEEYYNQINIGNRLRYIEFAETTTQGKVYDTLILWFPYNKDGAGTCCYPCMGWFGKNKNLIDHCANNNDNNLDFGTHLQGIGAYTLTVYKGSTATLGLPLRLWFVETLYTVNFNNT